ncbi:MAG: hypothetical protein R3D00_07455 [Bacteroidia bacterium]
MRLYATIYTTIFFLASTLPLHAQYYGVKEPRQGNWSLGINLGVAVVNGDVKTDLPAFEGGLFVQKSVSRALDFRVGYRTGSASGLDVSPTGGFRFNSALNGESDSTYFYDSTSQVFLNYKMKYHEMDFLFKINLNRIFSQEGAEGWDLYALAGMGFQFYQTSTNVWNESTNAIYTYENIDISDPATTRLDLKEMLDNSYETLAQRDQINSSQFGNYIINTGFVVGGGVRFSLSDMISLGFEGKYLFVGDDLLDGQQWLPDNQQSPDNDRLVSAAIILDFSF